MPLCPMDDPSSMAMVFEFFGDCAGFFNFAGDKLTHIMQVDMAGHELGERVGNGDDGLAEVGFHHAGGAPQCACTRHIAAMGGGFGAVVGHGVCPWFVVCCNERPSESLFQTT